MTIDSHCHIHDEKFASDLKEVLERANKAGVSQMISIGCDLETTKKAQKLANELENVYFSAGFHPHEAKHCNEDNLAELKKLALAKKCVAIGECGLDFYYLHSTKEEQTRAFIRQIELAQELGLPLIIHLRDAFLECVEILKTKMRPEDKVLFHCFSGTLEQAKLLESMGCFISISGIITFKKPGELLEVAKSVALERLLIETDCPYLAPHPHRGTRNEPAFLAYTLKTVAMARGQEEEIVAKQIHKNTAEFFNIR